MDFIDRFFYEELIPYLQPILLLSDKIAPFLQDGAIYLAVKLYKKRDHVDPAKKKRARYALVNIPREQLPRFIELPGVKERHSIIFLDDIVKMNLDALFPGYQIDSITNGVHSATWVCEDFKELYDKYIPGWQKDPF